MFRGKLGAVCAAAGAEVVKDEAACDLAVLELDAPGAADRLRSLVGRGVPVLASEAVPNSQVEARLRALLVGLSS